MRQSYSEPNIYIIIVNWNGYSDTIECLDSLTRADYKNKKVIIVDNGSEDASIQHIIEWAEKNYIQLGLLNLEGKQSLEIRDFSIILIATNANLGFGAANNIGIRYAITNGADFVLLLNNDTTTVKNDFLTSMVKTALRIEKKAIIGGKIRYYSDSGKVWFCGGRCNFVTGAFYHCEENCSGEKETEFVTGCLMLIPREIIEELGYLNEKYFLNVEDIDFSYKARDAGYKLIVNCNAEICHKVSSTIGGLYSSRNQYYFHRNRMIFFSNRLSGLMKYLFMLFQFLFAIPIWFAIQLLLCNVSAAKGAALGYLDFIRGKVGKSRYY